MITMITTYIQKRVKILGLEAAAECRAPFEGKTNNGSFGLAVNDRTSHCNFGVRVSYVLRLVWPGRGAKRVRLDGFSVET